MSNKETEIKVDPFTSWAHKSGRRFLIVFMIYMVALPIIMCLVYGAFPSISMIIPGLVTILIIMIPTAIAEVGSYTPILGSSSYLTFATGNLMNLKVPCVLNAQKVAKVDQGTTEGDAIALIATAVSSIVTIVIMAIGMLLIVQLQPLLENENVSIAADYIMPALFGCMALALFGRGGGKTYVKNKLLSIVLPAIIVSVLAIMGVASLGMASWLMLVMIPLSILCARILWKKGIVRVEENTVEEQ